MLAGKYTARYGKNIKEIIILDRQKETKII